MILHLALLATLVVSASEAAVPPRDLSFVVVVNRSNPVASMGRGELSAVFMKRIRTWPGGKEIVPIDQHPRNRVRADFSRAIHDKSVAYVIRYWQRLIFSGRGVPPPQLPSDDAVMRLVANNAGAIGYVSRDADLDANVKAITVTR